MEDRKVGIFWEIIEVLYRSKILPHVMIIGSWAEYLYPYYFGKDYLPSLKTRDIDLYFGNPWLEVDGAENLIDNFQDANFLLGEHFSDTGKFYKEGFEVEFLSSQLGSGPGVIEIPFTGVKAEKLRDMDMLEPVDIKVREYIIKVPSPASYIAHKLYINPERRPISKRSKDIEAIRSLLQYLRQKPEENESLQAYLRTLTKERQQRVFKVAADNGLDIPNL